MILILKKILDLQKSKSDILSYISIIFHLFSVFDSVQIPYPKREFITDDESTDTTNAHVSKTEPTVVVKTEASSVVLTQQQPSHVTHSQPQQQQQQQQNLHIKQQPQQHNNIVQQTHPQQVNVEKKRFLFK
jgi:hypothetical protein